MANITNKPLAYITVNKGRKKIKQDKFIYLDNGTEFEVELHNPTQNTVLAKISINNILISYSGIVLRPGERIYLERYLDNPNKFKFETYNVTGNVEEVKKAIEKNGLIKVEFYNEDTTPTINLQPTLTTYIPNTLTYTNINDNIGTLYSTNSVGTSLSFSSDSYGTSSLTSSSASLSTPQPRLKSVKSKGVETGRVEQGSHSNQTFQTVNKKFSFYTTNVVEYHIKPVSQMYLESKDINKVGKYCTKCGRKGKPTDNFCAGCGNRF